METGTKLGSLQRTYLPALRKGVDYGGENCQIISFVLGKIKASNHVAN